MTLSTAILCLSLSIYHEGRGEPVKGQEAIAHVIYNRAEHKAGNVCSVVTEPGQFAWTKGKIKRISPSKFVVTKLGMPTDEKAWDIANNIAKKILSGKHADVVRGATFFHEKKSKPEWDKELLHVATIGHLKFYKTA